MLTPRLCARVASPRDRASNRIATRTFWTEVCDAQVLEWIERFFRGQPDNLAARGLLEDYRNTAGISGDRLADMIER